MHRSGTSALTRALNLYGVALGDDLMQAQAGENDRGYWEHNGVYHLHESLLAELGSSWDDPWPLPPDWIKSKRAAPFVAQARRLIQEEFADLPLWGVKDPRLCRLTPLWLEAIASLPKAKRPQPAFVIASRNPLEVADSLVKRETMSREQALWLWLDHTLRADAATEGLARVFVSYDRLLDNGVREMSRIAKALDLTWAVDEKAAAAELGEFLTPELRHHSQDDSLSELDEGLRSWLLAAHTAFGERARDKKPGKSSEYPSVKRMFFQVSRFLACARRAPGQEPPAVPPGMSHFLRALVDRDRHIGNLNAMLLQRSAQINELSGNLEDRDRHIRNLTAMLTTRDGRISELQEEISGRDQRMASFAARADSYEDRVAQMDATVRERDARVDELNRSLKDRDASIGELNQSLKDRDARIGELNQSLKDRDTRTGELNQSLKDRDGRIGELNQSLKDQDARIAESERIVADLTEKMTRLSGDRQELQERIVEIETASVTLREKAAETERRRDALARELASARRDLEAKDVQIGNLEAERLQRLKTLDEAQRRIAAQEQRRVETVAVIDDLRAQLAETGSRIGEMERQLEAAAAAKADLAEQLSVAGREKDKVGQELAALREQAQAEREAKRAELDEVRRNIAARDRRLDEMAAKLAEQEGFTGEAEQEAMQLQARLAELTRALTERDSELASVNAERKDLAEAEWRARARVAELETFLDRLAETRWYRLFCRLAKMPDPRATRPAETGGSNEPASSA